MMRIYVIFKTAWSSGLCQPGPLERLKMNIYSLTRKLQEILQRSVWFENTRRENTYCDRRQMRDVRGNYSGRTAGLLALQA